VLGAWLCLPMLQSELLLCCVGRLAVLADAV
jgi:hypothetical protein